MERRFRPARVAWLGAALLLAACGGPDVSRTPPLAQLRVNGFDLDIHRAGGAFQVVRVTTDFRSEEAFARTAIQATERVTGCLVRRETVRGGPRRIAGRLDC